MAQISANPAYADQLVNYVQEPLFPDDDEKIGLFVVGGLEEISALRQVISNQYIAHLQQKIESIVRFSNMKGVEILLFPEYSIPAEALKRCRDLSNECNMIIIAGSHVITRNRAVL